jgi:hypothetical protein
MTLVSAVAPTKIVIISATNNLGFMIVSPLATQLYPDRENHFFAAKLNLRFLRHHLVLWQGLMASFTAFTRAQFVNPSVSKMAARNLTI